MGACIKIELGSLFIVAEEHSSNEPEIPGSINIYLCDAHGDFVQDICTVRPHLRFDSWLMEFVQKNNYVDCLVWSDSDDEDYTNKFVIGLHQEE